MKKIEKGFTLIELLVVIAIIGILAAIVLVSVSGARTAANTSAFKAEMSSVRTGLVIACNSAVLTASTEGVAAAGKHSIGTIVAGSTTTVCGSGGTGAFEVTYTTSTGGDCTAANVKPSLITFTGC